MDFGWAMDWAGTDKPIWWTTERVSTMTDQERLDMEQRMALSRARDAEETRRANAEAIGRAEQMLSMAVQMKGFPYLSEKGLPDLKAPVLDQTLLVRMEDERGRLAGLQTIEMIDGEWKKKMLHGMRAKGACLRLGRGSDPILCEGYATGLSIDQVLQSMPSRLYVVVCFSDGNLVEVAKRYPNARVFADNDASGAGQRAAERSGKPWVMSDLEGEDANDLFRRNPMELAQKVRFLARLK
jgi:putative DNA primase/helicase